MENTRSGMKNGALKKANQKSVFMFIYESGQATMKEIALGLNLSFPTVMQNLKDLIAKNLIEPGDMVDSTGGRRARAYVVNAQACYTLGLDVTNDNISLVILDMNAQTVHHTRRACKFEDRKTYYDTVGQFVVQSINAAPVDQMRIMGMGIAVPAIVDESGDFTTNADPLGRKSIALESFKEFIPYPCRLYNDANAGGYAEFWTKEKDAANKKKSMIYLSVSDTVGGSIMIEDLIYPGEHQHSAEFGHMTLVPNGKPCYCGQLGCAYAYINTKILSDMAGGQLHTFFEGLQYNLEYQRAWEEYLMYLTLTISNIHKAFDCDLVIGGYLARYVQQDLEDLRMRVAKKNIFDGSGDYIRDCLHDREAAAVGAALSYLHISIQSFFNEAGA